MTIFRSPIAFVVALATGLLIGTLFWLPAAWFVRAMPATVRCEDPNGSVWRGRCGRIELGGAAAGSIRWQLRGFELLRGRGVLDLDWTLGRGRANGTLKASLFGTKHISLTDVTLDTDIAELRSVAPRLPWPVGVDAGVHITLERLVLDGNGPSTLIGRGRIENLRGLPQIDGSASFVLDAQAPGTPPVVAVSTVAGAPIDVRGTLAFKVPRSYELELSLRARGATTAVPYNVAGTY